MAWITQEDVAAVYPAAGDANADQFAALIDHVEGLAEVEIGEQSAPIGRPLAAVMVQIVWRIYLAGDTDDNITQEAIGGYSYTRATIAGFGLTNAEKRQLMKAAGKSSLWVQPITRGEVAGSGLVEVTDGGDPIPYEEGTTT